MWLLGAWRPGRSGCISSEGDAGAHVACCCRALANPALCLDSVLSGRTGRPCCCFCCGGHSGAGAGHALRSSPFRSKKCVAVALRQSLLACSRPSSGFPLAYSFARLPRADHFRHDHFLCRHPTCLERKFVVFPSEQVSGGGLWGPGQKGGQPLCWLVHPAARCGHSVAFFVEEARRGF